MYARRLEADGAHFNSALNACKNAEKPSYSAALFLLEKIVEVSMTPTSVTYNTLAGAHSGAPLDRLKHVRTLMAKQGVQANNIFVEIYLTSLIRKAKTEEWNSVQEVVEALKHFNKSHLLEAVDVITEAKTNRVKLSGLVRKIDRALKHLSLDGW
eukprot:TRINITY_DN30454_c0_g1_i2.p2 TRINITY_DN30454_c0_g1~~TRINITY_DN30454_c0_g1_i2.p2  ORF type:complete len:155 (+),score=23.94 TRINITY_DN30454_c0_g1_i2:652-1116(+)